MFRQFIIKEFRCSTDNCFYSASVVGFTAADRVPGKMEVYLQKVHPEHYERLKRLKVFA